MTAQEIPLPDGIALTPDVVFTADAQRPLSVHLLKPDAPGARPLPLLIWIFGGAYLTGNKEENLPQLFPFVQHGYAVASIEYRYSSEALFPAQLHDCACAVRFLRAHARPLGLHPDRFGVWGASSGGNLASLLGVTAWDPALQGDRGWPDVSSRVQAVCDWYGPTDFLQMDHAGSSMQHDAPDSPESLLIGGPIQAHPDRAARANPLTYIGAGRAFPPFLIFHGDQDPLVPFQQSELLAAALEAAGAEVTFVRVTGGGHGGALFETAAVHAQMVDFFDQHLRADSAEQ